MTGPPQTSFGAEGRGPRLLSSGRGAVAVSTVSTIVVLAALAALFWLAPGSAAVRHTFFNPQDMWQSFIGDPKAGYYSVGEALWLNIRMFLAAEVLILILALVIAVVRQSISPVHVPAARRQHDLRGRVPRRAADPGHLRHRVRRARAQPGLRLHPVGRRSTASLALVLSYSAYVSEVYRAGLNSVHQSQVAAAPLARPVAVRPRCAT